MGQQNLNPIDELKLLDEQVEQVNDLPGLKPIFFRLEEIAKAYPGNFQVQVAAGDVKQHLVNRGAKLRQPSAPPPLSTTPAAPPPMPPLQAAGPPPIPNAPVANAPRPDAPMRRPSIPELPTPEPPPIPPPLRERAPEPAAATTRLMMPPMPPMKPAAGPPSLDPPPIKPAAGPPKLDPPPMPGPPPMPKPPSPPPLAAALPDAPAAPPLLPPEPPAPAAPPPQYAQAQPDAQPAVTVQGPVKWKRALLMGGIVGAMFALVLIGILVNARKRHQGSAAGGIQVEIATAPPGASVRINGETSCTSNCKVSLAPGNYQVTAFLDGYEPAASGITVAAGSPASFSLALEPQAQSLRILTDLPQGKIVIDDQPPADLLEGQFIVDKIQPGAHTVKLTGKSGEASFTFEIEPAKIPSVTGPVTAKNLSAVMVASLGSQARVVTNSGPLKLQVNGQPEADAGPSGTDLKSFQPGVDELIVGEGKEQRSVKESFGPAPMLTAFFRSDLNVGTLIVSTGKEDGVRVFVNNRESPQKTLRGQVRIQTIGSVSVRVAKDGFEQPPAQTAEVKKGTDTRLDFTMKALPQLSTLQITGGTPGAEVLIDQRSVGTIGPDGGLTAGAVPPGDHVVGIRRDQFTPRQIPRTFRAGQTTIISGADAVLAAERPQPAPAPPKPTPAPAPKEVASVTPPAPAPGTMLDWEDNSLWRQDGGIWKHQGAAFIPYKLTPQGVFTFTVQLVKGGNLFRGGKIRWAVNRVDDKNYALYEMDSKNFWAKVVVKGKTLERTHIPLKDLEKQKSFTIQIDVVPEHIVHKMFAGGEWVTLDSWAETGRNFSQGKFGFLVQGNDEIGISEFNFQPK